MDTYLSEEDKAGKAGVLFFFETPQTSIKLFRGKSSSFFGFIPFLFLPATRTVSVAHISRPVLSQKYTVHSEVEESIPLKPKRGALGSFPFINLMGS